jgi:thiol-disulfide isomerase/thioredoxin
MKANPGKLTILMAKAAGCRPCRAFAKHYYAAAKHYGDCVFVEILGDESPDNRGMMKELKIKVTPTFVLFRDGKNVHQHGGINQKNFHTAIQEQLNAEEAGFGKWDHLIVEEEKKEGGGH